MSPPSIYYDAHKADLVRGMSLPIDPAFEERERPLRSLAGLLSNLDLIEETTAGVFGRLTAGERIYYTLMQYRDFAPAFFPVHDLCLLMGTLLARMLANAPQGPVALLDWGMLPVVVLSAGIVPGGVTFWLPPAPEEAESAARIAASLARRLPDCHWKIAEDGIPPTGAWIAAKDPLAHCAADSRFLEHLKGLRGGVFLASWDFLGVRIHSHTRFQWLAAGIIGSILQLPRPRRQSATDYPAILTLRPPAPGKPLRLALETFAQPGPGHLEQDMLLAYLTGPAKGGSMDLDPAAPARDGLYTLSPATWLTPPINAPQGRTLRAFAQVLRCQLSRERLPEAPAHAEILDVIRGEAIMGWHNGYGETDDGEYIAREVALGELDPVTGFLDEYAGNVVKLALYPLGATGKYLLDAGDIIFSFRGTANSVGKVGFVVETGYPAITGQSLCIIRPLPDMDPVWLYYYLQREEVVNFIRAKASGSSLLTINMESIRDIPVTMPSQGEIDAINEEHRKIAVNMLKVASLRREAQEARQRIHSIAREYGQVATQPARGRKIRGRPE